MNACHQGTSTNNVAMVLKICLQILTVCSSLQANSQIHSSTTVINRHQYSLYLIAYMRNYACICLAQQHLITLMRNYACTRKLSSRDLTAKLYCQHTLLQRQSYTRILPLYCYDCYCYDCYGYHSYGNNCYKDLAIVLLQLLLLQLLLLRLLLLQLLWPSQLRQRLLQRTRHYTALTASATTATKILPLYFDNNLIRAMLYIQQRLSYFR